MVRFNSHLSSRVDRADKQRSQVHVDALLREARHREEHPHGQPGPSTGPGYRGTKLAFKKLGLTWPWPWPIAMAMAMA